MERVLAQVGTAVFAMSGVLSATRQRLDIFSTYEPAKTEALLTTAGFAAVKQDYS
ncbi:MAG: hypothetical protein WBG38_03355 [Nodosilinea sp.]